MWSLSYRCDPLVRPMADRHYSRQSVGAPNFVPPGRCLVLRSLPYAYWVTSWPFTEYVKHAWAGAWVCSAFRREGGEWAASSLITAAVAASLAHYGEPPSLGMVTFLDREHVRPIRRRGVDTWGYTWTLAGFRHVGETAGGLMAFQLLPEDMPPPEYAIGDNRSLFAGREPCASQVVG